MQPTDVGPTMRARARFGVTPATVMMDAVTHLVTWIRVAVQETLAPAAPSPRHALRAALTVAGSSTVGGVIALAPLLWSLPLLSALPASALAMFLVLAVYGWVEGQATGGTAGRSAAQAMLAGSMVALVVFALTVSVRVVYGSAG